jgi:chromosome segregation ATPase
VKRESLEQEVRAKDPLFAPVLEKRKETERRIETYKNELAVKRDSIESQVKQLRRQLAEAVGQYNKKVTLAKTNMAPDRERIQVALTVANNQLRAAQVQRASVSRSVAQLRKSAGQSEPGAEAQSQLAAFLDDLKRLDQEIAALKDQVRLLKLKLLLVRI